MQPLIGGLLLATAALVGIESNLHAQAAKTPSAAVASIATTEVPAPNPRVPPGAWRAALGQNNASGPHPRLLGSQQWLRDLAGQKSEAYNGVVKGLQGQYLQADIIIQAVDGLPAAKIDEYVQQVLKNVASDATNDHQDTWLKMNEAALVFDGFHEQIAPADREKIIAWLNAHLGVFTTDEGAFHNSTLSKIMTYLHVAYATWGENPRAGEFREQAIKVLYEGKVVPVLRAFGAGGGFTEAGWYARGSLWNLVQALELARRVEGYDGFGQAPQFFYNRLAYEMFQPYPGLWLYGSERFPVEGDGSIVYGGATEYPRLMRTVLAQYFRGSQLSRAVANKARRASNPQIGVEDFLRGEESDAKADLTNFPLAHLARGIGKVYARSDWSDDATWFRFDCGPYFAGHQHLDIGNFEIFRREPLATESGEYEDYGDNHSANWLTRSVAHNVILVHQPDEKWPTMRDGGRIAYANDGGQTKTWDWTVDTLQQWNDKANTFQRGQITAYQNTPKYLYLAADCTPAYAKTKLQSWTRQIVFLRPNTFVICDRVISTKPEFQKTWLLHGQNEPQIAGNMVTMTNGRGRLSVQTLLPERAKMQTIEGYNYGGQNFDPPKNSQSETAPKWRLEVQPPTAQTADVFLHVLSTDDNAPPPATLIQQRGLARVGARIGQTQVIFERNSAVLMMNGQGVRLHATVEKGAFE